MCHDIFFSNELPGIAVTLDLDFALLVEGDAARVQDSGGEDGVLDRREAMSIVIRSLFNGTG